MRHLKHTAKLNRNCGHRKAMLVNLACSLIEHDRIETTGIRAKELRRFVERLITLAKKGGEGVFREFVESIIGIDLMLNIIDKVILNNQ